MIIPSRWFAGGKGLDDFRRAMLHDNRISHLVDYPKLYDGLSRREDPREVSHTFSGIAKYSGPCTVQTMWDGKPLGPPMKRRLDAYDVLVRRNEAVSILDKVRAFRVRGKPEPTLDGGCLADKPFGLTTDFHGARFTQRFETSGQAPWVTAHFLGESIGYSAERGVDWQLEGPYDCRARD